MPYASGKDAIAINMLAEEVVTALEKVVQNTNSNASYAFIQGILIAGMPKAMARQLVQRNVTGIEQAVVITTVAKEMSDYFTAMFGLCVQEELAMLKASPVVTEAIKEVVPRIRFELIQGGKRE